MKILFLTRRAWPEIGGVEKHVLEVSKRLAERGNEVTVVSEDDGDFIRSHLADHPDVTSRLQGDSFKTTQGDAFRTPWLVYKIPVGKSERLKKFRIWGWLWKNRKLIEEADIVHAHDVGFWYWPFRFFYPKKPFFMTFHGYEQYPVPFKNKIMHWVSEKMAKGNLCVGDFLKKWYGTRADFLTYGGIDPGSSFGRNDPGSSLPLKIVFIGRLEKETGVDMYLKALRLLRKDKKDFQFIVCGDGPLRKEAEKDGQVLGLVENVKPYLQKARFIFSSGYLSILEAMAERKLIFSVYDNPLKEDYLKLGPLGKLIVICGNEKELVEKIKFYLKNPQKEKEMIDLAYNWVKGETWGKVTKIYLKLWHAGVS